MRSLLMRSRFLVSILAISTFSLLLAVLCPAMARAGEFLDISTRGFVVNGDKVMIGGFIIEDARMTVLIRAIGPSLALPPFNVPDVLADPFLQLFDGTLTQIAINDSWATDANAANIPVGLRPSNSVEAALFVTLNPGSYTAIVSGVGGGTGIGLVEVIKIGSTQTPFPATGQTTPYMADKNDGIAGAVAVPDDGTLEAGATAHSASNTRDGLTPTSKVRAEMTLCFFYPETCLPSTPHSERILRFSRSLLCCYDPSVNYAA